jgi:hypothetical protein
MNERKDMNIKVRWDMILKAIAIICTVTLAYASLKNDNSNLKKDLANTNCEIISGKERTDRLEKQMISFGKDIEYIKVGIDDLRNKRR